ncbi:MAG: hypothetical protein AAF564_02135 [Bacteroidota bacterium]
MAFFSQTLRPDHPYITAGKARYAAFLAASARYEEAQPLYEEVISNMESNAVGSNFFLALQQFRFGEMVLQMGENDEAATNLQAAVDAMEQALPAGHRHTARGWVALGEALIAQRKFVQAAHYLTLATAHLKDDAREATRYTHARQLLACVEQYAG